MAFISLCFLGGDRSEMKWLEVIHVRCVGDGANRSTEEILHSAMSEKANGDLKDVKLYRSVSLPADVCLHLHWERRDMESQGSTLGICLTEVLKEFCLVNHSLWEEETPPET